MSAPSESAVDATPLLFLQPDAVPTNGIDQLALKKGAEKAALQTERDVQWRAISEAGGPEKWVTAELKSRGVFVAEDPATLPDSQKASFKERKKVEGQVRRELKRTAWAAFKATHVFHVGAGVFFRDEILLEPAEEAARLARAKEFDLTAIDSVPALLTALNLTPAQARGMCTHRVVDTTTNYRSWTVPKRSGGLRTISAPKSRLKAAQHWLLRNIVEKLPVHQAAHGFLPERSIVSNAVVHAGADVVVKVDLQDFFPTVTFPRVKGLLRRTGLPESVAILAALIATESPREAVKFRGKVRYVATGPRALPQGAPTSPALTNALCVRLDRRLSGLARTLGFVYTRYADDLTFSWRKTAEAPKAPIGPLLGGVQVVVTAEGFRVNKKKTQVMRLGAAQRVTGLVINKAPDAPPVRVPRKALRNLRAAIHNRELGKALPEGGETLEQLEGYAAFVHMVDPDKGRTLLERIRALKEPTNGSGAAPDA